ncbi:LacI family DNA-binding transcriptional regulator [Microbacterium sp. R86528]|uniref:LacI family DNA-binding transcriptional regulator n=1 Tax=Microbacterium sp. R86528 TaxID=3093864 RepID=UPI0037C4EFFF
MTTIRDVANHASVAPMTVSRVLNQPDSVSPETRERVEESIAALKYVPNMLGQGLRKKRTMALGLIVSDITNPFAIQQIRGVTRAARDNGYTVIFGHTESDPEEELKQLRALIERRVDGIILSPVYNTPESVNFVQGQKLPVTVLDYPMPENDVDVVRCDTHLAARELTDYVLDLGHRRVAMLSGDLAIVTARERAEGFEEAMAARGYSAPVEYGHFTPESGYEMALGVLQSESRPTALVTASNFIALGAAEAARELGLSIPEDLSIVTFDNARTDTVLDPFFTGVVQPIAEMATVATHFLLDRILQRYGGTGRDEILPTIFEVHRSTAPYGHS